MFKRTGKPKSIFQQRGNPKADFYLRHDMITPDEHQLILEGKAEIAFYKNGNCFKQQRRAPVKVYPGRASEILTRRLLGLDPE